MLLGESLLSGGSCSQDSSSDEVVHRAFFAPIPPARLPRPPPRFECPGAAPEPYDLENGNAAIEIVIAAVAPAILADVSANAGDAPLVLRITTMVTNS